MIRNEFQFKRPLTPSEAALLARSSGAKAPPSTEMNAAR